MGPWANKRSLPAGGERLVVRVVAAYELFSSTQSFTDPNAHDRPSLSKQGLAPEHGDAIQDERHPTAQVDRRPLRAGWRRRLRVRHHPRPLRVHFESVA